MNTKVNAQTILIVFMLCVIVVVSTSRYANAQVGGDTSTLENEPEGEILGGTVPGGPGFIMVSAFDFKPYSEEYAQSYSGSALYNSSDVLYTSSVAGLSLPHGATITKVTLYYLDNSSSYAALEIFRADFQGLGVVMEAISTEGAETGFRSLSTPTTITNPIVDNQNYSYFLQITIPPGASYNILITNVRIDYAYTVYTPTVMKN